MTAVAHWSVDPAAEAFDSGTFLLRATARIERPLEEVFDFFAAAENLERITPPRLRFRITTPSPVEMRVGALIDYRLRLNGIPFGWRTEITEWNPPARAADVPTGSYPQREAGDAPRMASFTDTQIRGPYHTWVHRHLFTAAPVEPGGASGATEMVDEVQYRLPLWPLGAVVLPVVRRELKDIFSHRMRVLADVFG